MRYVGLRAESLLRTRGNPTTNEVLCSDISKVIIMNQFQLVNMLQRIVCTQIVPCEARVYA